MLNAELLNNALSQIPAFSGDGHLLQGDGYDAILQLLLNLRSVSFPAVVLEGRASGDIQMTSDGPLDTFTQSIWVMSQFGRGEEESDIYEEARQNARSILSELVKLYNAGHPELSSWDYRRVAYLKRDGGQNARGWELVLTFKENIALV